MLEVGLAASRSFTEGLVFVGESFAKPRLSGLLPLPVVPGGLLLFFGETDTFSGAGCWPVALRLLERSKLSTGFF